MFFAYDCWIYRDFLRKFFKEHTLKIQNFGKKFLQFLLVVFKEKDSFFLSIFILFLQSLIKLLSFFATDSSSFFAWINIRNSLKIVTLEISQMKFSSKLVPTLLDLVHKIVLNIKRFFDKFLILSNSQVQFWCNSNKVNWGTVKMFPTFRTLTLIANQRLFAFRVHTHPLDFSCSWTF